MPTIFIDNKPFDVGTGENLLKTCLGLGFDLPYFCWHPAMHSIGACRQCAVKQFKDEKDTKGRIVMACMTPVTDGIRISIDDPEARKFRSSVIEWLMTNHPHDCPVCDEGGECHLQDMTVMTGHSYRRFRFKKRTHRNQDLGPFVTHEMNRCIACYRCTRFYNDYALGTDFGVFASHNHVYFGKAESGTLESEFAGNLVEVCPTGVFTDKTFAKHYTRKWDLRTAPSVCVHCGVGCNTIPGERYGTLRRIRNRYNGEVNRYFLCDRGRYGYEFVNSDRRITEPRTRAGRESGLEPISREGAVAHVAMLVRSARWVIGIGSPRASLESNFALSALVGPDNFYSGVAGREHRVIRFILDQVRDHSDLIASLKDISECDAALVLGEDISNTAPMMGLALLQSLRQKGLKKAKDQKIPYWDARAVRVSTYGTPASLFVVTTAGTRLDRHATAVLRSAPSGIARTGFAIAHAIDGTAPSVADAGHTMTQFLETAAKALLEAERPLVISGTGAMDLAVLQAATNCVHALRIKGKAVRLALAVPECNSLGVAAIVEQGQDLDRAFAGASEGIDVAIVLENDLYRRAPADQVDDFLSNVGHLVVSDHLFHRTSLRADTVLPAATFFEGDGTLTNYEGRAQRYFQVSPPKGDIKASWQWIASIMNEMERPEAREWSTLDGIMAAMVRALPLLAPVIRAAPDAAYRVEGMKVAREHQRASGRTAMSANRTVFEPPPPGDVDGPFTFSMEGYSGRPAPAVIPRFWAPGWNSVQSVNKFQSEIAGELIGGNPGIRLFSGREREGVEYFRDVPAPFEIRPGYVLTVPLFHVFGSEELSVLSPGIAERVPRPYVAISAREAARIRVNDGDSVVLEAARQRYRLPVRIVSDLPSGVAGIPQGIPGCPVLDLPNWVSLSKVGR